MYFISGVKRLSGSLPWQGLRAANKKAQVRKNVGSQNQHASPGPLHGAQGLNRKIGDIFESRSCASIRRETRLRILAEVRDGFKKNDSIDDRTVLLYSRVRN